MEQEERKERLIKEGGTIFLFRLFHARLERNRTLGAGGGLVAELFGFLEFAVDGAWERSRFLRQSV